jgi:nicotinate-nucleotide adenylyltransferase
MNHRVIDGAQGAFYRFPEQRVVRYPPPGALVDGESNVAPIGIFGGTFDPVTTAMRLAQEIAESLRLAEIRLIPGGTPPHRAAPQVSSEQRLEMVRLAAAGNPLFTVDDREVKRSGPAYTIETLTELRREAGATRPLCVLLGADAFLELATWPLRTIR